MFTDCAQPVAGSVTSPAASVSFEIQASDIGILHTGRDKSHDVMTSLSKGASPLHVDARVMFAGQKVPAISILLNNA
ncbi:hypothetical protein ACVOMV_01290 [Mesorhizobium atlanticum]